ncbi:hypothetical protein LINGRAHAP2_LOCUS17497 [Linum grandiflorum]
MSARGGSIFWRGSRA